MSKDAAKRLRAIADELEIEPAPEKPRAIGYMVVRACGHKSIHATESFAEFMAGVDVNCTQCGTVPEKEGS